MHYISMFLETFYMIIFIDAKSTFSKLKIHSFINFLWIEV